MPSISSLPFCEEVTETVVPGHTCTSPPRCKRRRAVPTRAVSEEPVAMRLPAITTAPEFPGVIGTATGCTPEVNAGRRAKRNPLLPVGRADESLTGCLHYRDGSRWASEDRRLRG